MRYGIWIFLALIQSLKWFCHGNFQSLDGQVYFPWKESEAVMAMVSILVLTLNEEHNIRECLGSVAWADDITVLDSFSSDRTVEFARHLGAKVIQRKFDNWAAHQNWAMQNIPFKHKWVFYIDADERVTPELAQELCTISANADEQRVAFYVGRKNYFLGRWLKHSFPPGTIMRFFVPSKVRFERLVNPVAIVNGPHGYLKSLMLHYNFSKGLEEWVAKHNRYSSQEAQQNFLELKDEFDWSGFVAFGDAARRRKALKLFSIHLPCRGAMRFCYVYFVKLGFLDGGPGFTYSLLIAWYEWMIVLKLKALLRQWHDTQPQE